MFIIVVSIKATVTAVYMKASMTQRKNTVTGVNGLNRRDTIRRQRKRCMRSVRTETGKTGMKESGYASIISIKRRGV